MILDNSCGYTYQGKWDSCGKQHHGKITLGFMLPRCLRSHISNFKRSMSSCVTCLAHNLIILFLAWLVWRGICEMENSREVASFLWLLLLILCQKSNALLIQHFKQRRIRRRRLRLRFLNAVIHSFHYVRAQ